MEKLISYIENLLKWANETPDRARTFYDQAFGGLQFYILEHSLSKDEFAELEDKWYFTYRPAFEAIMRGGAV